MHIDLILYLGDESRTQNAPQMLGNHLGFMRIRSSILYGKMCCLNKSYAKIHQCVDPEIEMFAGRQMFLFSLYPRENFHPECAHTDTHGIVRVASKRNFIVFKQASDMALDRVNIILVLPLRHSNRCAHLLPLCVYSILSGHFVVFALLNGMCDLFPNLSHTQTPNGICSCACAYRREESEAKRCKVRKTRHPAINTQRHEEKTSKRNHHRQKISMFVVTEIMGKVFCLRCAVSFPRALAATVLCLFGARVAAFGP